jgi:hypothetical protein
MLSPASAAIPWASGDRNQDSPDGGEYETRAKRENLTILGVNPLSLFSLADLPR